MIERALVVDPSHVPSLVLLASILAYQVCSSHPCIINETVARNFNPCSMRHGKHCQSQSFAQSSPFLLAKIHLIHIYLSFFLREREKCPLHAHICPIRPWVSNIVTTADFDSTPFPISAADRCVTLGLRPCEIPSL